MEMDIFYRLYEQVDKCAPSSSAETLRALKMLPDLPGRPQVLDIGCGNGAQALVLAEQLDGEIIAVDNHQPFLDNLAKAAKKRQLSAKLTPTLASMFDLPFANDSFDLIWSEGAIYIIGFKEGLQRWKPLLKAAGYLVVTDMVWLRDEPPDELVDYWREHNPNMASTAELLRQAEATSYRLVGHFTLSSQAWSKEYYQPLRSRIVELRKELAWNKTAEQVFQMTEKEADIYARFGDWYGYEFVLLQKPG